MCLYKRTVGHPSNNYLTNRKVYTRRKNHNMCLNKNLIYFSTHWKNVE